MSMMVPPLGVTVPAEPEAEASVKVTEPKLARGTRLEPDSKSSTIHSALVSQRVEGGLLKEWVTFWPVVRFSRVATPAVLEEASTSM